MRPHTSSSTSRSRPSSFLSISTLASLLLIFPSSAWAGFDCKVIQAQGRTFNLQSLGGPKKLHWLEEDISHGAQYNYTFELDICKSLLWDKGTGKDVNCRHGTRVCAIREEIDESGTNNNTIVPIDIAGSYTGGRPMNEKFTLLRNSKSHADSEREGFRAELHGGEFAKTKQQAIIEFVCDRNRTGLEGDEEDKGEKDGDDESKPEGEEKPKSTLSRRDDNGCGDSDASLRFCSYKLDELEKGDKIQTLRLEWRTKEACEDAQDVPSDSSGWGFFTWFIIILFLATAAYLIFGSWLNYNRYGARGWDLLPHGDTIRDVPYILKDWARRVTSTIQGPGSRGGYSAV